MRKLLISIFILLLCVSFPERFTAVADDLTYLLIDSPTILYAKNEDSFSPIVSLPPSYFCCLISEDTDHYMVSYLSLTGYIEKTTVTKVDYTPRYVFPENLTFTIAIDSDKLNVRSSPNHAIDNIVTSITIGSTYNYLGTVLGSEVNPLLGSEWYYIPITIGEVASYGYVYSGYISATVIPANVIEKLPDPPKESVDPQPMPAFISDTNKIILIVCLTIPAIFIMFFVFKGSSRKPKKPRYYDNE